MTKLIIEPQSQSPGVYYDKENELFEISGRSFAKKSRYIYEQVMEWLDEYMENPNKETSAVFKFEFYDSSSAKMILEVLKKYEQLYKMNNKVEVTWFYPDDDDEIEEAGEIYANLVNVPIRSKAYSI